MENIFERSMKVFSALNENDYEEGFVAFIDILGTSCLLKRTTDLKDLAPLFSSLQRIKDCAQNDRLTLTRFSDSIYVVAPKDAFKDLMMFLSCCSRDLLTQSRMQVDDTRKNSIEHMECKLLRGGVCFGKYFSLKKYLAEKDMEAQDVDDLIVGPAITKAYELESRIAKYPRIAFDAESVCEAITKEAWGKFMQNGILVQDDDDVVYLDYIAFLREKINTENIEEFTDEENNKCIHWAKQQLFFNKDKSIFEKYEWILKYLTSKIKKSKGCH